MTPRPPTTLEVRNVAKRFRRAGQVWPVLEDVSFTLSAGEVLAVVGPNGAGKTTLMQVLAGLCSADTGDVRIGGTPGLRPTALVFQDVAGSLLPWRSNADNVALPFEVMGLGRAARLERVRQCLAAWRLPTADTTGDLFQQLGIPSDGYPYRLSGGQQQWLAILRAFIAEPAVLLLDEPFAALDAQGRRVAHERLAALHERRQQTAVVVSHDLAEAVYLADRVLVFSQRPGRVALDLAVDLPRPRPRLSVLAETTAYRDALHAVQAAFFGAVQS